MPSDDERELEQLRTLVQDNERKLQALREMVDQLGRLTVTLAKRRREGGTDSCREAPRE